MSSCFERGNELSDSIEFNSLLDSKELSESHAGLCTMQSFC